MRDEGCAPNSRTFVAAAKACSSIATAEKEERGSEVCSTSKMRSLEIGMAIHSQALERRCGSIFVESCLVDMYAKCGSMDDARRVFESMERRNMVAWTSLMLGYAESGDGQAALELFQVMERENCPRDARTFVAAVKACSSLAMAAKEGSSSARSMRTLETGMAVHREARKSGFESDAFVACGLVDLYAKCGSMEDARRIFERFASHDVVSWTALILGYGDNGEHEVAVELFLRMVHQGYHANARTFVAVIKACSSLAEEEQGGSVIKFRALATGMAIHRLAAANGGCDSRDVFVGNTLIDMYAKCGTMVDSRRVFDAMLTRDVVSYNAIMLGYAENDGEAMALELLAAMHREEPRVVANSLSYLAAVKACNHLASREEARDFDGRAVKIESLEKGMAVHARATEAGCDRDLLVASSLIDMYSRAGSMEDSHRAFDQMESHDVVSWTGLVSGYAENGDGESSLAVFFAMVDEGVEPDSWTLAAALKACGSIASSKAGRRLHGEICRHGLEGDTIVVTGLIDFYGKCATMADAQRVFDGSMVAARDVVAWTALVSGYGRQGDVKFVFVTFQAMVDTGVRPGGVTLLCVLAACSHAGLVERGKRLFGSMREKYGIDPGREHYHCVIDMLGRANHLEEALEIVRSMPFQAGVVTWMTILSACRKWKNTRVGSEAFDALVGMDVRVKSSAYLLMAHVYES
ncbi:pentatricopeptide repeat-containing protein At1g11290, chloroplastic-like [Selaginella moellendorffii]|uniref:pentatricopeptide repeat-containing protein At1g11290, chloroplastic-like n=1 Tax=Selaginella moellendorffii TaxID=88036 RepID=UPI000D1CC562|nr:pentatricopeptide repeat-containing protein At1g11290, chloroplastic-like [Selaginella moellendorffii]|eukprot:XP_024537145.1 pentatricopeptide repeat-containing protein At1g11290, chloroplastic-like [Selaginella moellendorffii]